MMTLQQAIEKCHDVATIQHTFNKEEQQKCSEEHEQLAAWLTKLQGFEDATPITETWLNANFQLTCGLWVVYSPSNDGDVTIFHRHRTYTISFNYVNAAEITTIGQLRMFLTIVGFGDFAQQLK